MRRAPLVRRRTDPFEVAHSHFWADTEDGIRLAGTMLGTDTPDALVVAHGFTGYRQKPKARLLTEALSERYRVFAFDLRGHGQSGGACTGGALEHMDVEAVTAHARARGHRRVVTIGWSLGGISVIRHAAHFNGVDGVIAISTPSRWGSDSKAVRRTQWIFTSRVGRMLAREVMRTHIELRLDMPDPPAAVVHKIAPAPIVLVHGKDDHFFGSDSAQELFDNAGEPRKLILYDKFGHAEDGFGRAFVDRLFSELDEMLGGARA